MQTFVKYHLSVHTYLDSNSLDDGKGQFIIPFHHGASTERNLIPVFGESFHNESFSFFVERHVKIADFMVMVSKFLFVE